MGVLKGGVTKWSGPLSDLYETNLKTGHTALLELLLVFLSVFTHLLPPTFNWRQNFYCYTLEKYDRVSPNDSTFHFNILSA